MRRRQSGSGVVAASIADVCSASIFARCSFCSSTRISSSSVRAQLVRGLLELADALAQRTAELGQLARPEDDQRDHQDDDQLRHADGTKHRHCSSRAGRRRRYGHWRRRSPCKCFIAIIEIRSGRGQGEGVHSKYMRTYPLAVGRRSSSSRSAPWSAACSAGRARRPGPGCRPVQGLYRRAEAPSKTNYVGEVESDRLVYSAITGMLQTLDPHSSFMDPRSYAQMRERQEGRYYGLGISINVVDGDITVVQRVRGLAGLPEGPAPRRRHRADRRRGHQGLDHRAGRAASCAARRARRSTSRIRRAGYDELIELAGHARRGPHPDRSRGVHARRDAPATSSCRTSARTPIRSWAARCAS